MRYMKVTMGLTVAGLVLFAAAIAGFAAHAPAVGGVFLALMVVSAASAFGVSVAGWRRARQWRDQQIKAARAIATGLPPDYGQPR